ncbi:MAG: undecaprenyl-diphosphatase [Crocinitomix sp.]|jgi:undecaprenyl-diphosphatase
MIEQLEQFDRDLFLTLNGLHADWLDPVMWWLSSIATMLPVIAFILYYAYKKGKIRLALIILGGIGLCVLFSDRISVELFKEVFQRYRPTHNTEIGDLVHTVIKPNGEEYRGGIYSFVSSHATNAMSMALFSFLHLRRFNKKWSLLFLWVILVSYTRIYLGVHYPADLICGAALGALIAGFVYWISLKFDPYRTLNTQT